ncbi:olfactory receptor 4K14-like [Trichosurus vulpecula]|uniref:olfactory receptor 4K14-like n=1 Tax=Trichosurus vulpecula TaxID=9337 RepID=UPI00186AEE4C|nr:olfactory receptor 4K14-like [Trichosurus vulpecula]
MDRVNQSVVSEFVLLGLTDSWELQICLFILFSVIYLATVSGNILIMTTVITDSHLHSPMYFLLANLSFVDLWLSSVTIPKTIIDFLRDSKTISFETCMWQVVFVHFAGGGEMVLLVTMAYDRYVAICKPLHYTTIMSQQKCIWLVVISWAIGLVHSVSQLAMIVDLPFCGPREIDSFFCDLPLVIELACMDTYVLGLLVNADSGFLATTCFILLLISYTYILLTVCHHSTDGVYKALSTCTAHIMVVVIFFVPCIFIYLCPLNIPSVDKFLAVFYAVFTPLLNPAIYTLRNKEMKAAMKRLRSPHVSSREKS